jgi:hypothetical protein
MKALNALCFLGLLISFGSSVYTSWTHILNSSKMARMEIVARVPDVTSKKVSGLLEGSKNQELILNELKYRDDFVNTQLKTMNELGSIGIQRTLIELILWIIVAVIFTVLQIRLYLLLQRDTQKRGRAEK